MEERLCKQCNQPFAAEHDEIVCLSCLKKLHGGRFGYRRMDSGPLGGKWPIFDHQLGRIMTYAPTEDLALGGVLVLDALESLDLIDADL